jgi:predicted homoserine dehydrogenase-like protein
MATDLVAQRARMPGLRLGANCEVTATRAKAVIELAGHDAEQFCQSEDDRGHRVIYKEPRAMNLGAALELIGFAQPLGLTVVCAGKGKSNGRVPPST